MTEPVAPYGVAKRNKALLLHRWKPYPAYKGSGIEWLGEIPTHWEVKPFKRIVSSPVNKGVGCELPFVALEHIISSEGKCVPEFEWTNQPADECAMFEAGDVLFGKLRPYLRKYLHADRASCCQTELLIFRPQNDCLSRYLFYLVQTPLLIALADCTSYGVKMPRTSWEVLGCKYFWLPPFSEQHTITAFLDRETAAIDALIAKKERLIELLQEKRVALISHAVTKGLDPKVPMKDSGVEWLGQIPAHWEVKRLKFVAGLVMGQSPSSEEYTLCRTVELATVGT